MENHVETLTLYRTGEPSQGPGFWTPDEKYARHVHFEATEVHAARLLPTARVKEYHEPQRSVVVEGERHAGDFDVLVFPASEPGWTAREFVVLNPAALRVIH